MVHTDNGYPSLLEEASQKGEKYDKTTAILVSNDSKGDLHEKRYCSGVSGKRLCHVMELES